MSDNKNKKSKKNTPVQDGPGPVTKFDYEIAKFLRHNLPAKEAVFVGIARVHYFVGCKAVDLLMQSKYANQFHDREEVGLFLNDLLNKKLFHRARKIVKMDGPKKKFKLDMHDVQVFEDKKEVYVWIYEPTSIKAWMISIGLILTVVGICLFPLWPSFLRTIVYYACIGALVILSSFILLSALRYVIFTIIWLLTIGKVHFWLLPNLTEDVGFFDSFKPVFSLETNVVVTTNEHQD